MTAILEQYLATRVTILFEGEDAEAVSRARTAKNDVVEVGAKHGHVCSAAAIPEAGGLKRYTVHHVKSGVRRLVLHVHTAPARFGFCVARGVCGHAHISVGKREIGVHTRALAEQVTGRIQIKLIGSVQTGREQNNRGLEGLVGQSLQHGIGHFGCRLVRFCCGGEQIHTLGNGIGHALVRKRVLGCIFKIGCDGIIATGKLLHTIPSLLRVNYKFHL